MLLAEDPGLLDLVPAEQRARALGALRARCLRLPRGQWRPDLGPCDEAGLGLLVLDGLLTRRVRVAGGASAELLSATDVLRPWDDDRAEAPVPAESDWRILEPARVAVLDRAATEAICAWPALVVELQSRLIRRARWLACLLALSDMHRLEPRLVALLWHLADRWGTVGPEGVEVPLRLTHETLGSLIAAERPSVTRSLQRLEAAGAVTPRPGGGWLLHGHALEQVEGRANGAVTRVTDAQRNGRQRVAADPA